MAPTRAQATSSPLPRVRWSATGSTPLTAPASAAAAPVTPTPARDASAAAEPAAGAPSAARPPTGKPTPNEAQLTQRVLADLQRQIELMLEVRLREALAPLLARATDTLVRDARKELTAAMRDIVAKAIAKELGRGDER